MTIDKSNYTEEQQRFILERAKWHAQRAVYLQALAYLARTGNDHQRAYIKQVVTMADNAGINISWDDLSIAKTN